MRKMKDSGIEWIGKIPQEWNVCKILYCLKMPLTDGPHTTPELYDDGVPFVSAEAVSCGNGRIDFEHIRGFISEEFYQECCKKYVPHIDDIYMIKSGATTGKVAIVDTERKFTIWSPLAVFRTDIQKVLPKYMFYFLQSNGFQKQVELGWSFGTQQNIGMRALERLNIAFPPLPEQKRIADFLDGKCADIDQIRADIEKQIEILTDYKKSVITEAVTKGLNPKSKMKDSGIEWIGKIPEGWKTSYIKRLFDITLGKMINSEKDAGLENYLCAANIKWTGINVEVHKQMHFSEYEKKLYLLNDGDILVMEGGMAGTAAIYHNEFYPCYIQNSVMRCRSKNATNLQTFLYYWLFAIYHLGYIDRICNRATIQHYTKEKLGNTPILFPPLPEQKAIADYLDEKCSEIDATIAEKQKQLETLEEYKKSLIFEYVTGKKEVPA